jgi:2-methylcitrate dehydratase PrpD
MEGVRVKALTKRIANFVFETKFEQLPKEALEIGKRHILDTIGCILAGSKESAAQIITDYTREFGGNGNSTIIPIGLKTSPSCAGLSNGVSAHVLEFDDYEWPSLVHPSASVLPAVLSLGEEVKRSGKECLVAYLVGMETISKIGRDISPNHYDKGWHSTSTLGTLGAAASSAKLLKLNPDETRIAIGIASSLSSGLRGNFGTMTKAFHAGHAAEAGIRSAQLAAQGFTANQDILESKLGFYKIFADDIDPDPNRLLTDLGRPLSIVSPGIGKKLYPSCAGTHAVLDGIFHLMGQFDINTEEVESVECGIFYLYQNILMSSHPQTYLEGKMSLEFCVALALHERRVILEQFTDSKVKEPQIRKLMKVVNKFVDEEVGGKGTLYPGATVKIDLKNGKSHSHQVQKRKGSPANPLVDDEIIMKFKNCAKLIHTPNKTDQILDAVMNIEYIVNIIELTNLLIKR